MMMMATASMSRWRDAIPLRAAAEFGRCREAAPRLVRSAWGRQRIFVVAEALLRHGRLSGEEIAGLVAP